MATIQFTDSIACRPTKKPMPNIKNWMADTISRSCTKKILYKRIPILSWLPTYNIHYGVSDLVAGITVGLTVIPQGIAYSSVAGLPPQIGLYSSFMACFVYTIFGSVKDAAIGPTAIAGLLTRENIHGFGVEGAVLLCFLTGCVELLMGILQLGKPLTITNNFSFLLTITSHTVLSMTLNAIFII